MLLYTGFSCFWLFCIVHFGVLLSFCSEIIKIGLPILTQRFTTPCSTYFLSVISKTDVQRDIHQVISFCVFLQSFFCFSLPLILLHSFCLPHLRIAISSMQSFCLFTLSYSSIKIYSFSLSVSSCHLSVNHSFVSFSTSPTFISHFLCLQDAIHLLFFFCLDLNYYRKIDSLNLIKRTFIKLRRLGSRKSFYVHMCRYSSYTFLTWYRVCFRKLKFQHVCPIHAVIFVSRNEWNKTTDAFDVRLSKCVPHYPHLYNSLPL